MHRCAPFYNGNHCAVHTQTRMKLLIKCFVYLWRHVINFTKLAIYQQWAISGFSTVLAVKMKRLAGPTPHLHLYIKLINQEANHAGASYYLHHSFCITHTIKNEVRKSLQIPVRAYFIIGQEACKSDIRYTFQFGLQG